MKMKTLFAIALLGVINVAHTPYQAVRIDDKIVSAAIERVRVVTGVPAVTVIAVDRNRTLYAHAFGLADLDQRIPATTRQIPSI